MWEGDRAVIRKMLRMLRVAIIVGLTLGALAMAAVEVWGVSGVCPVRKPCPARLYLGRSDSGPDRFLFSVSHSWHSTIGYLRLFAGQADSDAWDEESEAWFHAICVGTLYLDKGKIVNFASMDDVFPSHVFLRALVVPRGFFFVLFAAYPTIVFIRGPLRRRCRRKRGLCGGCGYDLTGNESGVCPECGREIAP